MAICCSLALSHRCCRSSSQVSRYSPHVSQARSPAQIVFNASITDDMMSADKQSGSPLRLPSPRGETCREIPIDIQAVIRTREFRPKLELAEPVAIARKSRYRSMRSCRREDMPAKPEQAR
ncbi:hypothetical protein K466DRAFT_580618 [Polyporus arcularius HHB13444]|uniref:Uncharacterized protein n=1 Tax=Polyporus arcularius HHB13444 TaxID=1314778 RepID=A0A5C3PWI2_9APHY|nr:hypothetical protein K466DRAFT_580618 [Polyporus arcularius HHB13444]